MRIAAIIASSLALVTASTLMAATPAAAKTVKPQTANWAARVTTSAMGGYILGNPIAKNRMTEYVSYTCNHCAQFEREASAPLKTEFITKGNLNVEVRNYVRDPVDLTAAMLARCGGAAKFFGNHNLLMSTQDSWMKSVQAASPAVQKTWYDGSFADRMKRIASSAGFYGIMQKRGISKTAANICLSDEAARTKLMDMTKYGAETAKIEGTPSFVLNDKLTDAHSWAMLKPNLTLLAK